MRLSVSILPQVDTGLWNVPLQLIKSKDRRVQRCGGEPLVRSAALHVCFTLIVPARVCMFLSSAH